MNIRAHSFRIYSITHPESPHPAKGTFLISSSPSSPHGLSLHLFNQELLIPTLARGWVLGTQVPETCLYPKDMGAINFNEK